MIGRRLLKFVTETAKRILSFNTSSAEIASAGACLLIGIFIDQVGMPLNMLEFQLPIIWRFELISLGIIHLFCVLYISSNSTLRIWLSFASGLFWVYLMLSLFDSGDSIASVMAFIMALSMWTGFIARSFRWAK